MNTVGVRELKARLSAYLRQVRSGRKLLVTEHGRVIAELRPPQAETRRTAFERAIAEGSLLPASHPGDTSWLEKSEARAADGMSRELLDAERAES